MQKIDYQEILKRQADDKNPLLSILTGIAARLDDATAIISDVSEDAKEDGAKDLGEFLDQVVTSNGEFFKSLEDAGLFLPLVLKVQVPLSTNDPDMLEPGACLAYNKERTLVEHLTLPPETMEWFEGDPKMYVRCRLWIDGTLQVMTRIEDQPW